MASIASSLESSVTQPGRTTDNLQQLIDRWHQDLLQNKDHLLEQAEQLNRKQQALNKTTESIIAAQELMANLEENLDQFQTSVDMLTKHNDELKENMDKLNGESRTILPHIRINFKTEQDRSTSYELMDSVDKQLSTLESAMQQLNEGLGINTDDSIFETTKKLQTCLEDIDHLQETIKQIKL